MGRNSASAFQEKHWVLFYKDINGDYFKNLCYVDEHLSGVCSCRMFILTSRLCVGLKLSGSRRTYLRPGLILCPQDSFPAAHTLGKSYMEEVFSGACGLFPLEAVELVDERFNLSDYG